MSKRVHYIDWLRVIAVLLLFPFHVSRVFNAQDPFYVKSAETSAVLSLILGFIDVWHMPLLFFLAGAASYFALTRRSSREYVAERVKRLLLPFVFGWLVLIPPQTWYGARFNSGYTKSFLEYLLSGDFLLWNIRDGGDYYGGFGLGHLWFILWLFAISLAALPLLRWGSRSGVERLSRWARRLSRPAWWLLGGFMILVGSEMPDPVGKNVFYYFTLFALGYVTMFDGAFAESAERWRWPAVLVGLALSLAWPLTGPVRDALPDPSLGRALFSYGHALGVWLTVVGAIGLGRRHLDRASTVLAYLAPASYPLYILHQTVIVVIAFYVVRMPVGTVVQWLVLLVASVTVTFTTYELVRRVPSLRCACGIKPVPVAHPQPSGGD